MHCASYTTPQLQLHYIATTACTTPTLNPAVVGEMTTATIATSPTSTNPTTFRSISGFPPAIRDSQQPTSPIGFLFLKLPPPPCAVLLVLCNWKYVHVNEDTYIYIYIFILYIYTYINIYIYVIYIYTYPELNLPSRNQTWHLFQSSMCRSRNTPPKGFPCRISALK